MISIQSSSDKPDKTAYICRGSVYVCVGWVGSVPELKEVNSISPGNSVLGQELWAIYKERRKVAKMLSQTCIQEQSRHQAAENSVSSLHRMLVGHPWGACLEGDQKSLPAVV